MKTALYFLFFIIVLIGCDISPKKLTLINRSKDKLYYRLLTNEGIDQGIHVYEILPESTVNPDFVMGGEGAWEYKINSRDSVLYIYIFKTNKINDSIIKNSEFEVKGWKVRDLEKLNWSISYPDDFR